MMWVILTAYSKSNPPRSPPPPPPKKKKKKVGAGMQLNTTSDSNLKIIADLKPLLFISIQSLNEDLFVNPVQTKFNMVFVLFVTPVPTYLSIDQGRKNVFSILLIHYLHTTDGNLPEVLNFTTASISLSVIMAGTM